MALKPGQQQEKFCISDNVKHGAMVPSCGCYQTGFTQQKNFVAQESLGTLCVLSTEKPQESFGTVFQGGCFCFYLKGNKWVLEQDIK